MELVTPQGIKRLTEHDLEQRPSCPEKFDLPTERPASSIFHFGAGEFPFCALSKNHDRFAALEVKGQRVDPLTGNRIPYSWRLSPNHDYGLAGPQGMSLLFESFQIWDESGRPADGQVFVGRMSNLLDRLGLPKRYGGSKRDGLYANIRSLVGSLVTAKNCFFESGTGTWDPEVVFTPFSRAYLDPEETGYKHVRWYLNEALTKSADTILMTLRMLPLEFHTLKPSLQRFSLFTATKVHRKFHRIGFEEFRSLGPISTPTNSKNFKRAATEIFDPLTDLVDGFRGWDFDQKNQEIVLYGTPRAKKGTKKPPLTERQQYDLERICEAVGTDGYRNRWAVYLRAPKFSVDRALGLLKERSAEYAKKKAKFNRGKLLDKIIRDDVLGPSN